MPARLGSRAAAAHRGFLGSATSGGCPDPRSVSRSLRPCGMVAARSLLLPIPPKQFVHAERTSACSASNSAPPAAENTDTLSGVFTPNATVIARPKVVKRAPLNKATRRVLQPRTRRRPKSVSAAVAIIANAGIMAAGKNQLSLACFPVRRSRYDRIDKIGGTPRKGRNG